VPDWGKPENVVTETVVCTAEVIAAARDVRPGVRLDAPTREDSERV